MKKIEEHWSRLFVFLYCHRVLVARILWQSYGKPRQHIRKPRQYFADKGLSSQSYGLSSSQVPLWELDHKEGWVPKNWCFWIVVLEKTLETPFGSKENKPVHPKRNHPWVLIERTDAEAETPVLWPSDVKNWLIGKVPDAGKDWRWEEKRAAEGEMVGKHHRLKGHELGQTPGASEGQGGLACCSPWDCKKSDMT